MSDVNPIDGQPHYGKMTVGGYKVPGIIKKISGADKKWKFDVVRGVNSAGATADFKGEEIAENIVVDCDLTTTDHFVELAAFRRIMPAQGKRPDAMDAENAILNNNRIRSVELRFFGQEVWEAGKWTIQFIWGEHNPSKATQTGAANKSTSATSKAGPPSAVDQAEKIITGLLAQAKAVS